MMTKKNIIIASLVLCSLLLLGNGFYIKAKARLADWLIANTWEARILDNKPEKPWPWADTWVVARIEIPRLGLAQYVMQDASGESLAFGPGAVMPVTEAGYNFIAGHRDTHFSYLDKLQVGDEVEIKTYQGLHLKYRITGTEVIDVRNGPMTVEEESRGLSLITCWPMDSIVPGGPLRYVVSGAAV